MGIRDSLDRLRSTRVGRTSKYDSAEHEAMAERYEKKKRFHESTKKPKEESLKDKAIKKVMAKGKDLAEKSKQHAIEELKKSNKSKYKKSKSKKSKPESKATSTQNHPFGFGFGNTNNEQFGFRMFNPQPTAAKGPEKEVDWSKLYDFRMESNSKRRKYNPFGSYDF